MNIQIKNRWNNSVIFEGEYESMKQAVEAAVKLKVSLSGSDLRGSDLSGSDLSGSNLSWSNLSRSDLSGSDLSRSNLSWSNLSGSNLSRSDLSGSILSGSNLSGSNLSGGKLDYTNTPMWCGTLKGVKVDFRLVCQMLLHIFALECADKRFIAVKKAISKYTKLSDKWHYYEERIDE